MQRIQKPFFEPKTKFELLEYVNTINPKQYQNTRNSLNGSVTKLSPYITCGSLSLNEIKNSILSKNKLADSMKLIQELAWRDFFQSVYLSLRKDIFKSIKREQEFSVSNIMPVAILEAKTGIKIIDNAINKLYTTGYLHNHERMWIAMLVCNVAGTSWEVGSRWMYYYLIDGDLASNTLSWQWVAGTFSAKKYFANQENLNKYGLTNDRQNKTFLDKTYEEIDHNSSNKIIPDIFKDRKPIVLENNTDYLASFFDSLSNKEIQEIKELSAKGNLDNIFTITTITADLSQKSNPVLVYIENLEWLISLTKIDFLVKQIKLIAPKTRILVLKERDIRSSEYKQILNQLPKQERMFQGLTDYYPSFFKFWSKAEKLVLQ